MKNLFIAYKIEYNENKCCSTNYVISVIFRTTVRFIIYLLAVVCADYNFVCFIRQCSQMEAAIEGTGTRK